MRRPQRRRRGGVRVDVLRRLSVPDAMPCRGAARIRRRRRIGGLVFVGGIRDVYEPDEWFDDDD